MRERALLAAEAARTANDEEPELDDAGYVDPDVGAEMNFRPQEGWSASVGGARAGFSDRAGSRGAWPERSDGGLPVSAGRAFRDDITGAALPPELAMAARAEEIKFTQSWNAWGARPVSGRRARAGKGPIGGRWVDHNKGDSD
eukprot:5891027-Alexandrium_andersonii.AAC.1